MMPRLEIAADASALAAALARRLENLAENALAERGRFMLAIPGGSVVALLARGAPEEPMDVSGWHWFWTDERCVPPDHPQSNFGQAHRDLLAPLGVEPACIHAVDASGGPEVAAAAAEAELGRAFAIGPEAWPVFDAIVLGVGEDGHVASLFPGHPALQEQRHRVAAVRRAPKPPPERITLTLPVIGRARHVVVVAAGEDKAGVLERIWRPVPGTPPLPARQVFEFGGIVEWMVDRTAAARLNASTGGAACPGEDPA